MRNVCVCACVFQYQLKSRYTFLAYSLSVVVIFLCGLVLFDVLNIALALIRM